MQPYKLDLSQFSEKLRDEISFTINNVSDSKIKLTTIAFAKDYFTLELPSSIDAGKSAEGKLKLNKDAIDKNFEKSFTIECNDEKTSRFTVPVKRTIRPSTATTTQTSAGK